MNRNIRQTETTPYSYPSSYFSVYKKQKTISRYIESFDGTLLAVDITLPESTDTASRFPAILIANRSNRRNSDDPEISLGKQLVPYGYAFVSFELRGCGVSFGINDSFGNEEHCKDLISIVNWVYAQDWCSKKIGLLGCSNRAYIQLCTAALNPEHISAVTPVVAVSDFYYQNYPNGVSAIPSFRMGTFDHRFSKEEFLKTVDKVDSDTDGSMAYEAFTTCQYENNRDFFESLLIENLNRDSAHPNYHSEPVFMTIPPYGKLNAFFSRKDIRQHQFIGQLESGTLGQLAQFIDFGGSVCLGPWTHEGGCICHSDFPNGTLDLTESYRKWYDSSLKGIENGFSQMPAVSYYMFHAPSGTEWRFSESWPPENEVRTRLYFNADRSGTCSSVNDSSLTLTKPEEVYSISYQVRDDICVFQDKDGKSRYNRSELFWKNDMTEDVDNKGLTFTSAPLFPAYNNEMAGCISVDLWISCSAKDVDLIVYAEEVLEDGTSLYIKDGVMRASHRISAPNPAWEKMGAAWHTSMTKDVEKCLSDGLDKPTHIQFAIDPLAYHFQKNSRLRITVTCANNAAFQHYMYKEEFPTLCLYTGGEYASFVSVPFLEDEYNTYRGKLEGNDKPATLYVFEKNLYLYTGTTWKRFPHNNIFNVKGNSLLLDNGNYVFCPEGCPEKIPHLPYTKTESRFSHPFPAFRRQLVDTVSIDKRDYSLFVPECKNLYLDIFKDSDQSNLPCIIYIHGYGWPYCGLLPQLLALHKHGYAIAGIDIRNYPPNQFPDYINDAKGAIRYLRAHAETFGLDPNRFATYGVSLGGNTSLMLGLSGDDPSVEGTVGGNTQYSSRVQACAAGYAWSDLLNMGSDIAEEFKDSDEFLSDRICMTDGEYSPSSEIIDFAGKGKGLGILRQYIEHGCTPYNELYEQKIAQAKAVSPVSFVNPSVPPIALFGGHGMSTINIAFKQCLRTFEALNAVDALTFLYGNTCGEYGEKPETIQAITAFFDQQLQEAKTTHILSVSADPNRTNQLVYDYVSHPVSKAPHIDRDGFWIKECDILPYLKTVQNLQYKSSNGWLDLHSLYADNISAKFHPDFQTMILQIAETSKTS